MPRFLNLVFQGGGVKGLCYAGAYAQLPRDVRVRVVGGASAGAIAAALIARGFTAEQLRAELQGLDFETILDSDAQKTLQEIREVYREAKALLDRPNGKLPGAFALGRFWSRRGNVFRKHIETLRTRYGLFVTDGLRTWLGERIPPNVKMHEIFVEDLRILGSALTERNLKPFTKEDTKTNIVDAVVASASIPFFFTPSTLSGYMFDGGLLSNFPILLFQREPFPTVGFRLFPLLAPNNQINTFPAFLRGMAETMLDGHDRFQPRPSRYHEEPIYLPSDISAIDFNLSKEAKATLFKLGEGAGAKVNWQRYSAEGPQLIGIDPDPDKVVTRVLQNSDRLANIYRKPELWPEKLEADVFYTVRVEMDGTVHYEVKETVQVSGKGGWYGGRSRMQFDSFDAAANVSIVDIEWTMDEVGGNPIARFPATNDILLKGFVYTFLPPVMAGQAPRTMVQSWRMPKEFARGLLSGGSNHVGYAVNQRAHDHNLRVEVKVLIDQGLGPVQLSGTVDLAPAAAVAMEGRGYAQYVGRTTWTKVTALITHDVLLSKST
jgi:NTE family protein